MVKTSVLNDALVSIVNAERGGKRQVMIRPSFEVIDDHRSGKIVVELNGRINKCGVVSPRFDIAADDIEKWVVNLLPSRQFGHIILTTSYGIMDHEEARRRHTGG